MSVSNASLVWFGLLLSLACSARRAEVRPQQPAPVTAQPVVIATPSGDAGTAPITAAVILRLSDGGVLSELERRGLDFASMLRKLDAAASEPSDAGAPAGNVAASPS